MYAKISMKKLRMNGKNSREIHEISFIESPEQSMRILAQAIQQTFSSVEAKKVAKTTSEILKSLENENALPPGMNLSDSEDIFVNCYPLHPSTAALLPILSQRIGQNERTMFSYLGSQHEFGFKELLKIKNLVISSCRMIFLIILLLIKPHIFQITHQVSSG